jgi:hypothetical protein
MAQTLSLSTSKIRLWIDTDVVSPISVVYTARRAQTVRLAPRPTLAIIRPAPLTNKAGLPMTFPLKFREAIHPEDIPIHKRPAILSLSPSSPSSSSEGDENQESMLRQKAKLLLDNCAIEIEGHKSVVMCCGCQEVIKLDLRMEFDTATWWEHKRSCQELVMRVSRDARALAQGSAINEAQFLYGWYDTKTPDMVERSEAYKIMTVTRF